MLVDSEGKNWGIIPTRRALEIAREQGLDLVEVAEDARPPVCRVMDFGKFKYSQKKREQEAKKKLHQIEIKEIRFRPRTDKHDLEIKMQKAREFLLDGDKVQITMMFRGREMAFMERYREILMTAVQALSDIAKLEKPPAEEGRRLILILTPGKKTE